MTLGVASSGDTFKGTSEEETSVEVKDGKINGDALTWSMDVPIPMPMTLDCQATVTGDTMDGTVKAGDFGNFPLTGKRE